MCSDYLLVAANPFTSTVTGWPVGLWWAFVETRHEVEIRSPAGGALVADGSSDPEDASGHWAHDIVSLGFKIGLRGFTVTAWEDEAALKRGLSRHHAEAMRELFGQDFVASVWTATRMNRIWVECPSCGSLEDVSGDHRDCSECHASMPERPAF